MAFLVNLTPRYQHVDPPKPGPRSVAELRASVKVGQYKPWGMMAGTVAAALIGAIAVTAFRAGPPERQGERYYEAKIPEPTTTGGIERKR